MIIAMIQIYRNQLILSVFIPNENQAVHSEQL